MRLALLVACIAALLNGLSLRSQTVFQPLGWLPLFLGYAALATFALLRIHKQGRLRALFTLRSGDLSIGVLVGMALLAAAWLIKTRVVPAGSGREGWLFQIHALVGSLQGGPLPAALLVLVLAVLEEIVWRGLVAHDLEAELGLRRAFPAAAALYAACHVPTVWTLADGMAGANPLLLLAALGAGLVWTFMALRTQRFLAVCVSHAIFSYFALTPLGSAHLLQP